MSDVAGQHLRELTILRGLVCGLAIAFGPVAARAQALPANWTMSGQMRCTNQQNVASEHGFQLRKTGNSLRLSGVAGTSGVMFLVNGSIDAKRTGEIAPERIRDGFKVVVARNTSKVAGNSISITEDLQLSFEGKTSRTISTHRFIVQPDRTCRLMRDFSDTSLPEGATRTCVSISCRLE
jgi:hypothetical protein